MCFSTSDVRDSSACEGVRGVIGGGWREDASSGDWA